MILPLLEVITITPLPATNLNHDPYTFSKFSKVCYCGVTLSDKQLHQNTVIQQFFYLHGHYSQKMYKIYDDWPNLAKKAYDSDLESGNFKNIDHIVFAGMGGSGAIGDLFESILSKTNIHVTLVKGYLLPKTVDENTLVVTTSVSGNTEETLTILESTLKLNCQVIAFCGGGKMKQYCIDNNINFRIFCYYFNNSFLDQMLLNYYRKFFQQMKMIFYILLIHCLMFKRKYLQTI